MRKLKILMIAPTPFFADRGCHTRIYEEIKALQKKGHKVRLCTYGLGRDVPGVQTARTVNFPWYGKLSAGPSKTKILLLPFLLAVTLKQIRRFRPDVVHAHLHEGACIAKICRFFYPRAKYVFDMQGSLTKELLQHDFMPEGGIRHRFLFRLEKKINSWHTVIVSSERIIDELDEMGCDTSRCINVGDGVDTDYFSPRSFSRKTAEKWGIDRNKRRILYMGLLEKYQGIDVLLDAFQIVKERHEDVQLIIIGYPNIKKYKMECRNRKIDDAVVFTGRVSHFSLPDYLSLADLAAAPKISDTEGNAKIHVYMAMGMATAAFDTKVSREILGGTGIYAKRGDARDLAEKLISCLDNPKLVQEMGRNARKRAEEMLSWDLVSRKIEKAYQSAD